MKSNHRRLAMSLAVTLSGAASPALADKIDGDWCATGGRHFSIDGPKIVTERGQRLEGRYSRHAFAYELPAPDKQAGSMVRMLLRDPMTVMLRIGDAPDAPVEIWKRCDMTS